MPLSSSERRVYTENKNKENCKHHSDDSSKVVVPCGMKPLHLNIISRVLHLVRNRNKKMPLQEIFPFTVLNVIKLTEKF
jgi:hypothetical protein